MQQILTHQLLHQLHVFLIFLRRDNKTKRFLKIRIAYKIIEVNNLVQNT